MVRADVEWPLHSPPEMSVLELLAAVDAQCQREK